MRKCLREKDVRVGVGIVKGGHVKCVYDGTCIIVYTSSITVIKDTCIIPAENGLDCLAVPGGAVSTLFRNFSKIPKGTSWA